MRESFFYEPNHFMNWIKKIFISRTEQENHHFMIQLGEKEYDSVGTSILEESKFDQTEDESFEIRWTNRKPNFQNDSEFSRKIYVFLKLTTSFFPPKIPFSLSLSLEKLLQRFLILRKFLFL